MAKASPAAMFSNYDNVMLADEMGLISCELKGLEARQESARAEMTRRKLSAIEGRNFVVVKATSETSRFDSAAVKKEMGVDWYEARQVAGTRTTFTVARKDVEVAPEDARAAAEALFRAPR